MHLPQSPVEPRNDDESFLGFAPADSRVERRNKWGDVIGKVFLIGLVVALGAGAIVLLSAFSRWSPQATPAGPPPFVITPLAPEPGSAIPSRPDQPPNPEAKPAPAPAGTTQNQETLFSWVDRVSTKTDIPARVLLAYANAELSAKTNNPGCHLTWATLAGVGRAESQHGQHGGAQVKPDGNESKPIIGVALDGSPGVLAVPDTDHGELDGDPVWDHAVGPMQFAPATWRKWGVRASADGKNPDPQNIDDATMTAGRYLCAMGGDLAMPKKWWTAVLTYNNSTAYGQEVFSNADAYARASLVK